MGAILKVAALAHESPLCMMASHQFRFAYMLQNTSAGESTRSFEIRTIPSLIPAKEAIFSEPFATEVGVSCRSIREIEASL
jgi:hypothetical protein